MSETLWPIPPNWAQGVNETLEWMTSIADSPAGVEQRMSLRTDPRRRIDYSTTVTDTDRAFFDNLVSATGASVLLLPLWFDRFELTAPLSSGSTQVMMTTALHEYIAAGSAVAIFSADPRDNVIVEIDAVLADRITFVTPTATTWPVGTVLYPLTPARFQEQPKASRRSDRVWDVSLSFIASRYNPWATTLWTPTVYRTYPVLTTAPDDIAARQTEFQRIMEVVDSGFAEILHIDTAGAGVRRQAHAWMTHGFAENAEFRAFLYALRGRQKALWLPTFTADFDLVEPVDSADTTLVAARCGFADIQGVVDNRRDIQILLLNGTALYRRITSASIIGGNEHLVIDSAVGQDIAIDDIHRISIMSMARLDGDGVEVVHHTDTEGASTCAVVFRTFLDQRNATAWVPYTHLACEGPEEPVAPSNTVIARVFNSAKHDAQFQNRIYPLFIDGVEHDSPETNLFFDMDSALTYTGDNEKPVLFLELIATDSNSVALPRAEQPVKWEIVSAPKAVLKTSVDRNTYILYEAWMKPVYAGIRLGYEDLIGLDTILARGQQPDGNWLYFTFTYQTANPTIWNLQDGYPRWIASNDYLTLRDAYLVVGHALDTSAMLYWFWNEITGQWNGSPTANPATGTGGVDVSYITGTLYPAWANWGLFLNLNYGRLSVINGGDRTFSNAPPLGFTPYNDATGSTLTWNPAAKYVDNALSNGNLEVARVANTVDDLQYGMAIGTPGAPTGQKVYWETAERVSHNIVGVANAAAAPSPSFVGWPGKTLDSFGWFMAEGGPTYKNNVIQFYSAVVAGGVVYNASVRATTVIAGKKLFEITWDLFYNDGNPRAFYIGVGNSSASLMVPNYAGFDNNSVGYHVNWGHVYHGGAIVANNLTVTLVGETILVAVDSALKKIWFLRSGDGLWNGQAIGLQNPELGIGGINISAITGDWYPFLTTASAWGTTTTANFVGPFVNAAAAAACPSFAPVGTAVT